MLLELRWLERVWSILSSRRQKKTVMQLQRNKCGGNFFLYIKTGSWKEISGLRSPGIEEYIQSCSEFSWPGISHPSAYFPWDWKQAFLLAWSITMQWKQRLGELVAAAYSFGNTDQVRRLVLSVNMGVTFKHHLRCEIVFFSIHKCWIAVERVNVLVYGPVWIHTHICHIKAVASHGILKIFSWRLWEGWVYPGLPPAFPLDYFAISPHALAESLGDIAGSISHTAAPALPPTLHRK